MRIDAIHIDNFLSFQTFSWERLDPRLNVVVGPNRAGKTNLLHALRAARHVVRQLESLTRSDLAGASDWAWARVRHRGDDTRPTRIGLDLALTTVEERDLLAAFLAAALYQLPAIQQDLVKEYHRNLDDSGMRRFGEWLQQQAPSAISWLLAGRLVVSSDDGGQRWDCLYQAPPNAALPFWWDLRTPGIRAQATPTSASLPTLFGAWRQSLPDEARAQLDRALMGEEGGHFPARLDLSGLPAWGQPEQDKPLRVDRWTGTGTAPRFYQQLQQLITPASPQWYATGSLVWQRLLDSAFVFTQNVRQRPQKRYSLPDLWSDGLDLSGGKDLAAFLYRKKVGNDADRATYAAIQQEFRRFTGRSFEAVDEGPDRTDQQPQKAEARLSLVVQNDWGDVPLEFSGAGIAEVLFLSTVLTGTDGHVILLDEPALNLHPTTMTTLLDKLQTQPDRLEGAAVNT